MLCHAKDELYRKWVKQQTQQSRKTVLRESTGERHDSTVKWSAQNNNIVLYASLIGNMLKVQNKKISITIHALYASYVSTKLLETTDNIWCR